MAMVTDPKRHPKRAPIQVTRWDARRREGAPPSLPDELVRLASEEYNRQGFDQSHERLCERGGLSDVEIITLLADALEHERRKNAQRPATKAGPSHSDSAHSDGGTEATSLDHGPEH